ncbi:MAG TPA: DUF2520 domain-containing protein [Bacteroidales bacterium]|nr:DUF2520 domain-containing protein [Bacteroidales bacterium]
MISNVIMAGSGNLAFHLAKVISQSGITIRQIFSRNLISGKELALITDSSFTDDIDKVFADADAYIFAMNDEADKEIAEKLKIENDKILLHTAGSLSMDIFKIKTSNYGVFYPFQTFSKDAIIDFKSVPVCLEASNDGTYKELQGLCKSLSCKSYQVNEEQRKILHLSGVFACNFMNHCVFIGERILENEGLSSEMLKPLLQQSFEKIINNGAYESQTGPARRNDKISIEKHLDFLKKDKNLYDIYRIFTESISKTYNVDGQ